MKIKLFFGHGACVSNRLRKVDLEKVVIILIARKFTVKNIFRGLIIFVTKK